jgi:adenylate cyclase class 2
MTTHFEREIKLRFDDAATARATVIAAGGQPLRARRLQHDRLLDTEAGYLRERRSALRVRSEPDAHFITFKGPVVPSAMKLREEIETGVADAATVLAVLEHLGFRIWFRYEKFREEFRLGDAVVAIDETPIGTFVEVEGTEQGVADAATGLGRGPADFIVDSYRSLYVQHQTSRGLDVNDMLFAHG